jgi:hypothetical protein
MQSTGWYRSMKKLLQQPSETARIARIVMAVAHEEPPLIRLTAEREASFDESLAQAERCEFATDEQMRALRTKHGL